MPYEFQKTKILVVDDLQPMRELLRQVLQTFGFVHIETCANGEEGFSTFVKFSPDLVIVDWVMEPMNGIDLASKIRTDKRSPNPFVPIMMMTGYSARRYVEKARDVGITEILVKPFTAHDLYARIEHIVEKPRQFVQSPDFFGPDRRRRKNEGYKGPVRRMRDRKKGEDPAKAKEHKTVLNDLVEDLKKNAPIKKPVREDDDR